MTTRSIIDVDVSTAAFQRFTQLFDKYSENLRKQPEIWKKINAEHQKLASGFASLGNKMDAHFESVESLQDVQESSEKSLMHSESLWGGIEKASGKTAGNVARATGSLLRWTGILSGITGLLGYFTLGGISDLGRDVYGWRKSAMGLGVTSGQERAFNIAFGQMLGSPAGFLGGINNAVSNLAEQGPLYALGVNPNQSTSQVAVATLERLRSLAQSTPTNQLGILESMYRLGNLGVGVEDLRRLQSMSGSEFEQWVSLYQREQGALGLNEKTQLAWAEFVSDMEVAGAKIENVFVKGLEPLAGPLAKLTNGFEHMLSVIGAQNGPISKDINSIAAWMEKWNGQITKPAFLTGLENFVTLVSDIGSAASGLDKLLNKLGLVPSGASSKPWNWWGGSSSRTITDALKRWNSQGLRLNNPENIKFAHQAGATLGPGGFANFVSMYAGLLALGNQLKLYQGRGIDTVQSIVSTYAPAADGNNVPAYIKAVDKDLGVSATQRLNLSDPTVLAALMRAIIRQELGFKVDFGGDVTRAAVQVTIKNNTGGSATQTVAAQGAQR